MAALQRHPHRQGKRHRRTAGGRSVFTNRRTPSPTTRSQNSSPRPATPSNYDHPVTGNFDLVAASLRSDAADSRGLAEALAVRLEQALPTQCRVERRSRKFLSREKVVRSISVDAGENRYALSVDERGAIETTRSSAVRGIVLKNDPLPVDDWLDSLARDLAEHAQASADGRAALERLLL